MDVEEVGSTLVATLEQISIICDELEIESAIQTSALETYYNLNSCLALEKDKLSWLCCAIYSELQQAKMKDRLAVAVADRAQQTTAADEQADKRKAQSLYEKKITTRNSYNISLTKFLRSFNLSIIQFIYKMKQWSVLAQHSTTFQRKIEDIERRLGITQRLLKHYKRIFKELYVRPEALQDQNHYQALYEFGWLLFLVVRNELPEFSGLNIIMGFQVLICVIELVYVNALEVPQSVVINTKFAGVPEGWTKPDFDGQTLHKYNAIEQICSLIPELPKPGVRIMKNAFFHKALLVLFMEHRLLGNDNVFRDLVKDGILDINLVALNRSYESCIADVNEMDERILLNYDYEEYQQEKVQQQSMKSVDSPLWHEEANLLNETQQKNLEQLLKYDLPDALPKYIRDAIDKDDTNLRSNVQNTMRDMCLKFKNALTVYLKPEVLNRRIALTTALYYRMLDRITTFELGKRPQLKMSQLLMQSMFNATLLACSLELVLYIFEQKETALQFPWVIDSYGIDAYEFQKVLELVVMHNKDILSRNLIKHLYVIEAHCLDSLIWRKGAAIWSICDGKLPTYQAIQTALDTSKSFGNDKENAEVAKQQISNIPATICLRKFYKLAIYRLTQLCKELSLLKYGKVYSRIWHIVEHSITAHTTELLQQRHLDQLVICGMYLFGRACGINLSFSLLLQFYRRQVYAHSSIYRKVPMPGGKTDDIIAFYNKVYLTCMSGFVSTLWCHNVLRPIKENKTNGQRISPAHNVFVSPASKPTFCTAPICIKPTTPPLPLKRGKSPIKEQPRPVKRPNILQRRTMLK